MARGSSEVDAQDLLHEAFVSFLGNLGRFDASGGDGALVRWFHVTLRRKAKDLSAKRRRELHPDDEQLLERASDQGQGAHRVARRLVNISRLQRLRRVASDLDCLRVASANREKVHALLERLGEAVLRDGDSALSSADLADRVGWSPFQLWKMTRCLEEAVRLPEIGDGPTQALPPAQRRRASRAPRSDPPPGDSNSSPS